MKLLNNPVEVILNPGTRIWYAGDQANMPGYGTVKVRAANRFGEWVDILLDDRRELKHLPLCAFSSKYYGGTRLVLASEYQAWRAKQMENFSDFARRVEGK